MTIDELNRRFGAPGRIVFHMGHCGYPEVVLTNKYGTAEIALMGANVLSYRPTGHSPVIFRPEKRDYNRGESFHGGIPVCWPQFGRVSIPGLPQHGFARVMPFAVKASEYTDEMTEVTLILKSDAATRELWPHEFELELKVSVSMKLNLALTTRNTGDEPFEFTTGFHPYFLVRDRDGVTVKGVADEKWCFAGDMSEHRQEGDLKMDHETDNVYFLKSAPKHEFAILDSGLRRAIALVSSGNGRAVIWNPGPEERLPDFQPDDWKRFVCVEPVTIWPEAAVLKPGETHELLAAIQSTAEETTSVS